MAYTIKSPASMLVVMRYDAKSTGTLVYDADCGFCTRSAIALSHPVLVRTRPWQGVSDLPALGLPEESTCSAAYWISREGTVLRAEAAISGALIARGGIRMLVGYVIVSPPVRPLSAWIYKVIAQNRHALPGGTDTCRLSRE